MLRRLCPPPSPLDTCSRSHAPVSTFLHTFPNTLACAPRQQPKDFILLRIRVEKVDSGEIGYDDLTLRCRRWSKVNVREVMHKRFGCVAHNVDHDLLGLNCPSYQPTADSGSTALSPPERAFAKPFPCEAVGANSRAINLFGLRHCVTAAVTNLTRTLTVEKPTHVLKLGRAMTTLTRNKLESEFASVSAVGCRSHMLGLKGCYLDGSPKGLHYVFFWTTAVRQRCLFDQRKHEDYVEIQHTGTEQATRYSSSITKRKLRSPVLLQTAVSAPEAIKA